MLQNINSSFPRQLSAREKDWLFSALPENKSGYKQYREIIDKLLVIGNGRFGESNLILGEAEDTIDLEVSSSPIFAVANITFEEANIYITIHEETDGQVEVDIKSVYSEKIPDSLHQTNIWTYSAWLPGQKAPHDNTYVREVHLIKDEIVLAIAPVHKKIWIYNSKSGINHFIPVTNFYNEIILAMNNKDPEIALNPGRLFTHLNEFTDDQLINGFLIYNKHWKRIVLDYHFFEKKIGKK